jgi:hypothetical protein
MMVMLISEDSSFMTGCRNKSCGRVENESDCAGAVIVLEISSTISPEVAWVEKDGGEIDDVDDDDDDAMDVELCCCC